MTATTASSTNPVLTSILETQRIALDGGSSISLHHPEFPTAISHIDRASGELLQRLILETKPRRTLEIGLAYGVSTLFICDALTRVSPQTRHVVIDPFQHGKWRGLGLRNLEMAGFAPLIDFREQRSEIVLPNLLAEGGTFDLAFIDGLHRFDQVMVEFYYINRLLAPGGMLVFDDADRRSVSRVIRHALTYPCYELFATSEPVSQNGSWLGGLRRRIARGRLAKRYIRADVLTRDWDLGLAGRCVAIRKTGDDARHVYFDADF